ncbi:helix-turn-helix transcriptional regulator [uncultured Tateyamaria sp.]|uniref:helix-turn-helix domain-containing protein n=1 Tax=uncultured Tateyamaria sp. TaxID=455651 RepID=UPI002625CC9F|nr:helix-turn-helix transcriptional regulator [uncultured Tateyamaria sp.]
MTDRSTDPVPGALAEREVLSVLEPSTERGDDDKSLIGNEVRFWRKERSLTGSKLAKLSDITPGMLTKIEQGKVAPSIQTLLSISNALNVPISMFFHRIEKSRYVSFVPADKRMQVDKRGTRAGHLYEMLGHNTGQSIAIEPFFVTYDQDSEPFSTFQEEGYKFIYMVSGHIVYRHGARYFPLHAGDSLIFDAMAPHGPAELKELPSTLLSVAVSSRYDPGLR